MTLLERIKGRVETDLSDGELNALIAEAQSEIRDRYGPDRDVKAPVTAEKEGLVESLDFLRPIDTGQTVKVVEFLEGLAEEVEGVGGVSEVELAADDFRILNGGRTMRRLWTGSNRRRVWAKRVEVTYVPVDDQARRDETVIRLVKLAAEHAEVEEAKVGDVATKHLNYTAERERILAGAAPRKGLMLA